MGDLPGRLAAPSARMLDIGTGVGALAVAFAEAFPQLHVLGIDVLDRALALARHTIAASGGDTRVTVRKQDVAGFSDDDGFDLAWLPAPFIPQPALHAGLPRVAAALRPGGWLMVGHGKFDGTPVQNALTRLKTISYGGTPLAEGGGVPPAPRRRTGHRCAKYPPPGAPSPSGCENRPNETPAQPGAQAMTSREEYPQPLPGSPRPALPGPSSTTSGTPL